MKHTMDKAQWPAFLTARDSGETVEIDEEVFDYFLDVLPPVAMPFKAIFANGTQRQTAFGFAEGYENVTAFWKEGKGFYCRKTNTMNPYA